MLNCPLESHTLWKSGAVMQEKTPMYSIVGCQAQKALHRCWGVHDANLTSPVAQEHNLTTHEAALFVEF